MDRWSSRHSLYRFRLYPAPPTSANVASRLTTRPSVEIDGGLLNTVAARRPLSICDHDGASRSAISSDRRVRVRHVAAAGTNLGWLCVAGFDDRLRGNLRQALKTSRAIFTY